MHLSIIIPAYNEGKNIRRNLAQVIEFLTSQEWEFEVLVVDDGSTDQTAELVEQTFGDHAERGGDQRIRLLKRPHLGKGPAICYGVSQAQGEYILFADADLATPIEEVRRFLVWITEHGFDVVIASREGLGAQREGEPFYRHLMGRVFNFLIRLIVLPGIRDTQCGFKLFSRQAARDIFGRLKIYTTESRPLSEPYVGALDVEALFLARRLGYKIKTVPVNWKFVETTRLHPLRDSLKMLRDVLRIRWNALRGEYAH